MVKGNFFPSDYLLVMPLLPVSFCDPTFCSAVLSYDWGEKKKLSFRWKGLVSLQSATKIFLLGKIPFFFFLGGILVKNS